MRRPARNGASSAREAAIMGAGPVFKPGAQAGLNQAFNCCATAGLDSRSRWPVR